MNTVTSTDGTKIAYDAQGEGPAVILVDGALSTRQCKLELAKLLASRFTVYGYDRRGRGDSGDTRPYGVAREVEDIETLIDGSGGAGLPVRALVGSLPGAGGGRAARRQGGQARHVRGRRTTTTPRTASRGRRTSRS